LAKGGEAMNCDGMSNGCGVLISQTRLHLKRRAFRENIMSRTAFVRALFATCALLALPSLAAAQSASPWPAGDELGMANTLGPATWRRCAPYLANGNAKSYELSHIRSNTMPQSPFGTPLVDSTGRPSASPAPCTPSTARTR